MKIKQLIFLLLLGTLSLACQPSTDPNPATMPQDTSGRVEGTGDSAGGNTYHGRPLESYILANLEDLPSYRKLLKPWLTQISQVHSSLGRELGLILTKKTIYLIPGPLTELPTLKIGSAVRTEQVALQDFEQIWINTEIFNKMTDEDQMRILVHEMLIGLRIFPFDSPYRQCLMTDQKKEVCSEGFSREPSGSPSSLSESDYREIRTTTQALTQSGGAWTYEQLEKLMYERGFKGMSGWYGDWIDVESITFEQLFKRFEYLKAVKHWPSYGYDVEHFKIQNPDYDAQKAHLKTWPWSPHESCRIEYSKDQGDLKIEIKIGKGNYSFRDRLDSRIVFYQQEYRDVVTRQGLLKGLSSEIQKFGDISTFTDLEFGGSGLTAHLQEMVCVDAQGGECNAWSAFEGAMDYRCSAEKSKIW